MDFLGRIRWHVKGAAWLIVNLWRSRHLQSFPERSVGSDGAEGVLEGLSAALVPHVRALHRGLRGYDLSWNRRILLRLEGRKFCLLWRPSDPINSTSIGGFEFFYFEPEGALERVIHEAYIGVAVEFRGKGVSRTLRTAASQHFVQCGLSGITTDIEGGNVASMRSALSVGYTHMVERGSASGSSGPSRLLLKLTQ